MRRSIALVSGRMKGVARAEEEEDEEEPEEKRCEEM